MVNTHTGIGGAFQQGASGLNASTRSIVESANKVVLAGTVERAPISTTDIVEPLLNIQKEQHIFNASAHVLDIADQALGALIDTSA
jgi:flagellar hook-associated protein FlgK